MKVLGVAILVGLVSMPTAATPSFTQKMLKPVIAYQCQQELKESKVWRAASWLMTTEQKKANQDSICGCVSENAMNEIGATDLAKALIDEAEKNRLVRKAVLNSLKGCMSAALR